MAHTRLQHGFTLAEMLVTLSIIAVAAMVIGPQILVTGSMRAQAASRAVIADILFAQNDAIARQSSRRVVFDLPNNGYQLTSGAGTILTAPWKGGGGYQMNFSGDRRFQGVTLAAADFDGQAVLEFDAFGSPTSGGEVRISAGTVQYRVRVAAFTGRVTIEPMTDESPESSESPGEE